MLKNDVRPGEKSVSDDPRLPEAVRSLDLGCIRFKLLSDDSPVDWTDTQAKTVEGEYRKFLSLHLANPEQPIVPDSAVDVFWHQHILDTEKYEADCKAVFGKFIHHFPYLGLRGKEDEQDLQNSFDETLVLYKEAFGEPPKDLWQVKSDCGCTGCYVGNCSAR